MRDNRRIVKVAPEGADPRLGMDDRALLDRLKNGDQAAFDEVFRAHYPALVILAQSLLHDRSASEDVVQEVMLELWRRRTAVTIQESLRAYLVRSTRNRALNQIRHANVQKRAEPHLIGEEASRRPARRVSSRRSFATRSPPPWPSCRPRAAKCFA